MAAQKTSYFLYYSTLLTHKQAMSLPKADFWKKAKESKVAELVAKNTWTVVDQLSFDTKVYKKKMNLNKSIKKYKTYYMVRGFEHWFGQDYIDT